MYKVAREKTRYRDQSFPESSTLSLPDSDLSLDPRAVPRTPLVAWAGQETEFVVEGSGLVKEGEKGIGCGDGEIAGRNCVR